MKILKIELGKSTFLIDSKEIKPDELDRENLLNLLNSIYDLSDQSLLEVPLNSELEHIKNPVEKEIVKQIIQKVKDFSDNVENIRDEVNSPFPDIK
ncbi:hypothetical protein [Staphylococcus aureus]|uniref:hypothetical protein n=1 Tax=Staphylococcus aureus TaxID=1280 RepID=UPI001BFE5F3A|nr:hypothetical protein [Staphylococcus aureus]